MTILDTFYTLFKGDASNLVKATKEVDASVKNLKTSVQSSVLSINRSFDLLSTRSFKNTIRDFTRAFRFSPLLKFSAASALFFSQKQITHFADSLDELSESTGFSVEQLSLWSDAVKIGGGDAETFQETVRNMSARFSEFEVKGKSRITPFFRELGISMTDSQGKARNFIDVLPELADAFSKIGKQQSLGIGLKMGLDKGTIMLLQKGREEVDRIIQKQRELGIVSSESAKAAGQFNDSWDNFKHVMRSVFLQMNTEALPILKTFLEAITDFGKLLISSKPALITFAISIAAIAFAISPLTSILISLAAAIGLVYDDIKNFNEGNKSFIGYLSWKYPEAIKATINTFKFLGDVIEYIVYTFKNLFWSFGVLIDLNYKIGEVVKRIWKSVVDTITGSIGYIIDQFNKFKSLLGLKEEKNMIGLKEEKNINVNKNVKTILNPENEQLVNPFSILNSAKNKLSIASSSPLNNVNSNSLSTISNTDTKSSDITIGDINIQTQADDAGGIASEIRGHLTEQMRQAINFYDDGVLI